MNPFPFHPLQGGIDWYPEMDSGNPNESIFPMFLLRGIRIRAAHSKIMEKEYKRHCFL